MQASVWGFAALGVFVLVPGLLLASARWSLDSDYTHSRSTTALPSLVPGISTGLVQISASGFSFRARVAGLGNEGPGLILLHGFPESSIMYEPLIEAASSAGFPVVAFDQRGYSPGARPLEISSYALEELVGDVFAIADAVGFDRFHLVGHDWGSIVGWGAAARDPKRVLSFVSLSIPHPGAILAANSERGTPFYVKVFRLPGVPETLLSTGGLFTLRKLMYGTMTDAHRQEYTALFSEPGALTAALNWYRRQTPAEAAVAGQVTQPVLYVFGTRDLQVFVREEVRALQPNFVTGPYQSIELEAGHWLMQEETDAVVAAVMTHLRAQPR